MYGFYPENSTTYVGDKKTGVAQDAGSVAVGPRQSVLGTRERSEARQQDPSLCGGLGHTATWYPEMEAALDKEMGYVTVAPMVVE